MSTGQILHDTATPGGPPPRRRPFRNIVTTMLFLFAGCAVFLGYLFYAEGKKPEQPPAAPPAVPSKVIQLDVLNGCGAKGAGGRFTDYLRASGFDVVELKNYSSSKVAKTIVIDRVGNLAAARKVAAALGVAEANVVQQLNPEYFVDVSVVIGADHAALNPGKTR
jgi:hypothetical protein